MMAGSSSSFPQGSSFHNIIQGMDIDNLFSPTGASAAAAASMADSSSHVLLYSLSVLKEKVHQLESMIGILIFPNRTGREGSVTVATSGLVNMIQEVILAASTLGCTIQQLAPNHIDPLPPPAPDTLSSKVETPSKAIDYGAFNKNNFFSGSGAEINFSGNVIDVENDGSAAAKDRRAGKSKEANIGSDASASNGLEVIELDAADLLAKYTHYCQVCGKGFRRDANLRMHMRAHGEEYKSAAALANPMKRSSGGRGWDAEQKENRSTLKYSCPHEGCRWNRKHAKFQPLKSVVCVKNHYKRSHCPKMYVCKRCSLKQFSVLSDLRTHEKHCGDMRWRCSCGTNFSRKDKLMGHVALFVGHTPQLNGYLDKLAVIL